MKIGVDEARQYFAHKTQIREAGIQPDSLPEWMEYHATDGVCLAFHAAPWPMVAMVHLGVKPSAWGHAVAPAKHILKQYAKERDLLSVLAWIRSGNRQAIQFSRRVGFVETGSIAGGAVIQQEWHPCQ